MRFNPRDPSTFVGQVQTATRLTRLSSGITQGATQVNNFRSKSIAFQQMNQQIVQLDESFHRLTPTQQNDWNTEALGYAGVPVCGCTGSRIDGQNLHRLVNYARSMAGLIEILIPADDPNTGGPDNGVVIHYQPPLPPVGEIQILFGAPVTGGGITIFQTGQGNSNPVFYLPVGTFEDDPPPGSQWFNYFVGYNDGDSLPACNFSPQGYPSSTTPWFVTFV